MTFDEYYNHYLTLHQNIWCRRLHIVGNIATLAYVVAIASLGLWWLLLGAPFVIYPFAWSGHFFFEKNKPAAWSDPLKAKASDWRMMWDTIRGKLEW